VVVADALPVEWLRLSDVGILTCVCRSVIRLPVAVCVAIETPLTDISC